jgi:glutathione S-transferase
MGDPIVYGFPRSTYVNIVRLILTHKDVAYSFHDLEPVMGQREHLALHPFNRVPILKPRRPDRLRDQRDRLLRR